MEKVMERTDLQTWVEAIDREYFTMFDFDYQGKVTYNRRLKTTGGQYQLRDDTITINPKMFRAGRSTVEGIIKHELCHYYIYNLDHDIPAHGTDFKRLLYRVGGARYAPRLPQKVVYPYVYRCQDCGNLFYLRKPLIFKASFHGSCGKCGGDIEWIHHSPLVRYER